MACVAATAEADEAGANRGHQLAKYLSCCAASQCAETHICSRRVAKAGAAACKDCGGGGGRSEWASTFAAALCDIFDCPAVVQREALDLVMSAVAFVSSQGSGEKGMYNNNNENDNDDEGTDNNGGFEGVGMHNDDDDDSGRTTKGGAPDRRRRSSNGRAADGRAHDGGGGSLCSSGGSDGAGGGLGSSWGSVSELALSCGRNDGNASGGSGGYGSTGGGSTGAVWKTNGGGRTSRWEDEVSEGEDEDDEAVRKGIWFPPPSVAGATDPLLTTAATCDGQRTPRPVEATRIGGGSSTTAGALSYCRASYASVAVTEGGGRDLAPSSIAAPTAAAAGKEPPSLAGRLRKRWQERQHGAFNSAGNGEDTAAPFAASTARPATKTVARRRHPDAGGGGGEGGRGIVAGAGGSSYDKLADKLEAPPLRPGAGQNSESGNGKDSTAAPTGFEDDVGNGRQQRNGGNGSSGGGEAGSEFVVLVSREATVRELAASVGMFPPEWLAEAFGLVVRRQVEGAVYDARARAAMKRAVRLLGGRISWKQVAVTEQELAALAQYHDDRIQDGDQNKEAAVSGRYWKVGLAAAGGGVLLFLSGGVAAPSVTASLSAVGFAAANSVSYVAPSLGAWLGYTSTSAAAAAAAAAATSGAGSVGAFSAVSGAAGAGVAGYKMTRRTAGVQEFHFLPLHTEWPLDSPEAMFEGASEPGLPVFICVSGWHEPGHDPRHTWGGIGYANTTRPSTPQTKTENDPPLPPPLDSTAAVPGDSVRGRREGKRRGAFAATCSEPASVAAPVAGCADAEYRTAAAAPAAGSDAAGGAVSRWFSSVRGTVSRDSSSSRSRSSSSGGSSSGGSSSGGSSSGNHGNSSDRTDVGCIGTMARSGGGRDQPTRTRNRTAFPPQPPPLQPLPDVACAAVAAPSPIASSFIDLGVGRAATRHGRLSSRGDGAKPDGWVGGGAGTGEERDGEFWRGGRRNRGQHETRAGGGVIFEGGDGAEEGEGGGGNGGDAEGTAGLEDSWEALPSHAWWRDFVSGGEEHVLVWERGPLTELHAAMRDLAWKEASRRAVSEALKRSALAPVVAAAALPLALLEAASGLDDPWGVVRSRALEAGRLLAAVLLARPVGSRPVTLLGYSMGAKLVFNCLEALAAAPNGRGLGIVENAVMLGTPIGTKRGRWKRARSAVAGRLINGYSSRDWLLALVYRSKSWSVGVAGTSRVEGCGVENLDLSGLVTWHLSYSRILPTVMSMLRLEE